MQSVIPYEPTKTNFFLIPFEESDKIGKIYIPDSARRPLNHGKIIKVGPDCTIVKVGQVAIFPLHLEHRIQYDRQTIYVLNEDEVLGLANESDLTPNA